MSKSEYIIRFRDAEGIDDSPVFQSKAAAKARYFSKLEELEDGGESFELLLMKRRQAEDGEEDSPEVFVWEVEEGVIRETEDDYSDEDGDEDENFEEEDEGGQED